MPIGPSHPLLLRAMAAFESLSIAKSWHAANPSSPTIRIINGHSITWRVERLGGVPEYRTVAMVHRASANPNDYRLARFE